VFPLLWIGFRERDRRGAAGGRRAGVIGLLGPSGGALYWSSGLGCGLREASEAPKSSDPALPGGHTCRTVVWSWERGSAKTQSRNGFRLGLRG
jgi:hypothetical protein